MKARLPITVVASFSSLAAALGCAAPSFAATRCVLASGVTNNTSGCDFRAAVAAGSPDGMPLDLHGSVFDGGNFSGQPFLVQRLAGIARSLERSPTTVEQAKQLLGL